MLCEFVIASFPIAVCLLLEGSEALWDLGRMQLYIKNDAACQNPEKDSLGRTVLANEKGFFSSSAMDPLLLWAGLHLSVPGQVR